MVQPTMVIRRISYIAVFFLLILLSRVQAQVINSASCLQADVQAALNAVTSSTTTVVIPAGTCNWTGQYTFTVPSGNSNLAILGAGSLTTLGGGDQTVIVDKDTAHSDFLLKIITGVNSSNFRFAGITMKSDTGAYKEAGMLAVQGTSQNVRLDHSHFLSTGANGYAYTNVRYTNWVAGVIDHNLFEGGTAVQMWYDGWQGDNMGAGDSSWASATNFGSASAIFLENNTFSNTGYGSQSNAYSTDCYAGGRFVFRFNTLNNVGLDVHPTGGGGSIRGCRSAEIYENTYNGNNSAPTFTALFDSSGTSLIWGNSAPAGYINFIDLLSDRVNTQTYTQQPPPSGWGYCGTAFNGVLSAWDGNTDAVTGYPCIDQPGQGQSDLLSGWFPSMINTVTGTISWPHQKLEPVYEWMNIWNPVPGFTTSSTVSVKNPSVLVANRDFYQYNSSFTGSSGTGSGVLVARPATCTTGVVYWATDQGSWNQSGSGGQGVLYKCTATNAWTVFYTPYIYPHPLVSSSSVQRPDPPVSVSGTAK